METALERQLSGGSIRIIPVRLDGTDLPQLLRRLQWIRAERDNIAIVARKITNLDSYADFLKAIQHTIDEAGLEFRYFHGYGVLVGCPRCGAPSRELDQCAATDYQRDDEYVGARCRVCGWKDGGEAF